jgi:hypothetical protein
MIKGGFVMQDNSNNNDLNILKAGNFTKNAVDYFKENIENQTNYMETFNRNLQAIRNNTNNKEGK